jgi:hypothetical protein
MRTFRGHRFTMSVPESWEDRSRHLLLGPLFKGDRAGMSVHREPGCRAPNAQRYAAERLEAHLASVPGWEALREVRLPDADQAEAVQLEFHNSAAGERRQYRRFYFRVADGIGWTAVVQLGRPSRSRMSAALDAMVLSLIPRDPVRAAPGAVEDGRYEVDRFSMMLPARWEDATPYELGRPREEGGLRNLVIRRERWGAAHAGMPDLERQAEIEWAIMAKTIPGCELIARDQLSLADGSLVAQLRLRRPAGAGLSIEQRMILVADADELFFLCLSSEPDPDEDTDWALTEMLASFHLDAAAPTPRARPTSGGPGT